MTYQTKVQDTHGNTTVVQEDVGDTPELEAVGAAEAGATAADTPAAKGPRRNTSIDGETRSVTFHAPDDTSTDATFTATDLSENVQNYLMALGLRTFLNQSKTPEEGFERLSKSELPVERVAGVSKPKVNPYRLAIAAALIEKHAAAGKELSEADAMAKAMAFNRSDFAKLKGDRTVAKHYALLGNEGEGLLSV